MKLDFFKSIINRVNFKTTIIPWMNGEPLLHKEYYEMIKYITDRNLPAYITTNGTIWNHKLFDHITDDTSIYQIIFSLDGLWDTNSIELARPGTIRAKVENTITRFQAMKTRKKSKIDMAVKLCRRGQDYEEIENYISYWLKAGMDYVCIGGALIDDNNTIGMRQYPCQYPDNNFMVIRHNGRAVFCAYNNEMVNNEKNMVGMLDDKIPLLDFYNNETYTKFRENQAKGIYSPICEKCGFAYTGIGIQGEIRFRNPKLIQQPIYYQQDYYNQFFSLKKKWKPKKYYEAQNIK